MHAASSRTEEQAPYATVNPYTGEVERTFPFAEFDAIRQGIERSHDAFLSWRTTTADERAVLLGRAADLMLQRRDGLARLITLEMGKRIKESAAEVTLAASILRYYSEHGPRLLQPQSIQVDDGEALLVNKPIGLILAIEPSNYPLYQVVRVFGPNAMLGNTILVKPSETTPQCGLALEQLFHDAGFAHGVYSNLFLRLRDVEKVIAHRHVQGVTLTGSERAGAQVAQAAGRHLKKSVLELGGNDPFIVLDSEGLEHTVKAATAARMQNTGQACIAAKRFIVMDDTYDEFVGGLARAFSTFVPGDPADPQTSLGPLSSQGAVKILTDQINDAVAKGAVILAGGEPADHPGAFLQPTLLGKVTPQMRAYHEELFGPVAIVFRASSDDEAIALANDTEFGLSAVVYGSNPLRARSVADRIESGMVWINQFSGSSAELPFGGIKRSGYGRELSDLGLFEFANRRLVRVRRARL